MHWLQISEHNLLCCHYDCNFLSKYMIKLVCHYEVLKFVVNAHSGIMERRVGLLLLFLLGASWFCDARQLGGPELSGRNMD